MAVSPFFALVKNAVTHTPRATDISAARVVFFPGETYLAPLPQIASNGQDLPPEPVTPTDCKKYDEFQGLRRGMITALRFWGYSNKGKPVFLVRCDCGRYAFRKILKWSSKVLCFDSCGVCEKTRAISSHNKSRDASGVRRAVWRASLIRSGITIEQCSLIEKYKLPADDLEWLKAALAEIQTKQVGGN